MIFNIVQLVVPITTTIYTMSFNTEENIDMLTMSGVLNEQEQRLEC